MNEITSTPAQPPQACPACGNADVYTQDSTHVSFCCGAWWHSKTDKWWPECGVSFSSAIAMRGERDAAVKANNDERGAWSHVYAILTGTEYGEGWTLRDLELSSKTVVDERDTLRRQLAEMTAELAEFKKFEGKGVCVYCDYIGPRSEIGNHVMTCEKRPELLLVELSERLEAERNALAARLGELQAERGVILNGASMVARYALPYFEKLDAENPTHDTAELLNCCRYAIEKQTPESNVLSVEWMNKTRDELTSLRRQLEQSEQADAIIQPTIERAKEILGAGNYDNIDHAAKRVVDERDDLRRQLQAVTEAAREWMKYDLLVQEYASDDTEEYPTDEELETKRQKAIGLTLLALFGKSDSMPLSTLRAALASVGVVEGEVR